MEEQSIIEVAEQYVTKLLTDKLSADHKFHDLAHTLSVREACLKLAAASNLSETEIEILDLAALFHDVGYTQKYQGHEEVSKKIATQFLNNHHYPKAKLDQLLACISVTEIQKTPNTILEKIMRDADLSNLGSADFFTLVEKLRHEWLVFKKEEYDDLEWIQLNRRFLKAHDFFTEAAQDKYNSQKKANSKKLKKMAEKEKNSKGTSIGKTLTISNSKSAQMMFKTASRNHIDLSNLADNKANIMLSVNAGIITLAIPVGSTFVNVHQFLFYPLLTLLITCLVSMIYATLATRPIKMNGFTTPENIRARNSNLFFFGNFYKMNFQEYQTGLQQVVSDEDNLENSIMRDLYFLGKSLGRKYNQLRICYNVFMIGIIIVVIVFATSFMLYN